MRLHRRRTFSRHKDRYCFRGILHQGVPRKRSFLLALKRYCVRRDAVFAFWGEKNSTKDAFERHGTTLFCKSRKATMRFKIRHYFQGSLSKWAKMPRNVEKIAKIGRTILWQSGVFLVVIYCLRLEIYGKIPSQKIKTQGATLLWKNRGYSLSIRVRNSEKNVHRISDVWR